MGKQAEPHGQEGASPKGGLLPFAALAVSCLASFFLVVLVFFFSDPSGQDVGALAYTSLAILLGLGGVGGWRMARRALKEGRPRRWPSWAASWIGIGTAVGVVAFLIFGYAVPPLAQWLIWS